MKNNRLYYGLIIVISMFVASCSSNDYVNVISDDADVVVSIDIQSLCDKAELNKNRVKDLMGDSYSEVTEDMSNAELDIFEALLDNPSESGIDFTAPIYVANQVRYPQTIVTMKMSSASDFEKLYNTSDDVNKPEIDKGELFNTIVIDSSLDFDQRIIFNDDLLIYLIGDPKNESDDSNAINGMIEDLLNQESSDSIVSTDIFNQMDGQPGDIKYLCLSGSDSTADIIGQIVNSVPYSMRKNLRAALKVCEEISMIGYLDFKDGEVVFNNHLILGEKLAMIVDDYLGMFNGINGSLNKYLNEDVMLYTAMSINGEKLAESMSQYLGELSKFGIDKESLKGAMITMDGDVAVTIALPENSSLRSAKPEVVAYITTKDNSISDFIYNLCSGFRMAKKSSDDNYILSLGRDKVYFGYDNNIVYFRTHIDEREDIISKQDNSIEGSNFASNIDDKLLYVAVNLYSVFDTMQKEIPISKEVYKQAIDASYIDVSLSKELDYKMRLVFGDTKDNSLKRIVDIASEFGGILSEL